MFGRVAVLAVLNIEDDLPTTVPATSGQDDDSSDWERVNTTQFDVTARDTDEEIDVQSQADSNVTAPAENRAEQRREQTTNTSMQFKERNTSFGLIS